MQQQIAMKRLLSLLLGAVFLIGGARPSLAQVVAPPAPTVYIVARGDTLAAIAQRFGVTTAGLAAANGLANPNLIYSGQRLVIPGPAPTLAAAPGSLPATTILHRLRPGQTLSGLARAHKLSMAELLAANGVSRPAELAEQTDILIPIRALSSLPAPFVDATLPPGVIQGQTGVAFITASADTRLEGVFGDKPLVFSFERRTPRGDRYWALLPTDAITPVGERMLVVRADDAEWTRPVPVLPGAYETQHIILPPAKGGLLAPDKTRPELERLLALWQTASDRRQWRGKFIFPIAAGFSQTSPYGTRRSYNGGPVNSFHGGVDWGAPEGAPIRAPAHGAVILAENLEVRGGAVIIDHGLGVTSNFWHLSRIDVAPGQEVGPGDVIGLVGTTGLSTAAHLHWEMRVGSVAVDPMQWTQVFFPTDLAPS